MTAASVYCVSCGQYWRPEHIYYMHKRAAAPDGGPSGRCRACECAARSKKEARRRARIKADPERYAAQRERNNARQRARYAALSPEEKRAWAQRRIKYRDQYRAKAAARARAYKERNPDKVRAYALESYYRVIERDETWRTRYNANRRARRLAQRLAALGLRSAAD